MFTPKRGLALRENVFMHNKQTRVVIQEYRVLQFGYPFKTFSHQIFFQPIV